MKRKIQFKEVKRKYGYKYLPTLLLSGVWFEKAGFKIGQQVTVTVSEGKVIIT